MLSGFSEVAKPVKERKPLSFLGNGSFGFCRVYSSDASEVFTFSILKARPPVETLQNHAANLRSVKKGKNFFINQRTFEQIIVLLLNKIVTVKFLIIFTKSVHTYCYRIKNAAPKSGQKNRRKKPNPIYHFSTYSKF